LKVILDYEPKPWKVGFLLVTESEASRRKPCDWRVSHQITERGRRRQWGAHIPQRAALRMPYWVPDRHRMGEDLWDLLPSACRAGWWQSSQESVLNRHGIETRSRASARHHQALNEVDVSHASKQKAYSSPFFSCQYLRLGRLCQKSSACSILNFPRS